MITKIAFTMLSPDPSVRKMMTHPLSLGFTAFDLASGTSSLPQSLGGAAGSAIMFNTGSRWADKGSNYLANKISQGLARSPRFRAVGNFLRLSTKGELNAFPKLRGATRFIGGLAAAEPGFRMGRRVGTLVPGFNHKPDIV